MKCKQIKKILSEYIDVTIEAEGLELIEEHIKRCDNCRHEYIYLKDMIDELKDLEAISAPPDFLDKVLNRIEKRSLSDRLKGILVLPGRLRIPMELTALAATACLVFVILFTITTDRKINNTILNPDELKTADTNEIDPRLRDNSPINLEFLLGASEGVKPITSRELTTVSSGRTSTSNNIHEYLFGVEDTMNLDKEDLIVTHIDTILSYVEGKVLSREHRKGISHPEYITMEIPADKYGDFLKRIEGMGSFQPPAPVLPEGYPNPVVLRIQFKSTE